MSATEAEAASVRVLIKSSIYRRRKSAAEEVLAEALAAIDTLSARGDSSVTLTLWELYKSARGSLAER